MRARVAGGGATAVLALILAAGVGAVPADAAAPSPSATRIGDRILDPTARGTLSYEASANIASFQQDGLMTHGAFQYVAWYRADRRVAVSRRPISGGDWQSIELDSFLQVDDSHNTIAMAVTPSDGRIHIALGTHGTAIRYVRSVPGLAAGDAAWTSKSFEATRGSLPGAPDAAPSWTYPQFETVKGKLLLTYRDGSTDSGRQVLARYDDQRDGSWTYLGQFTTDQGSYTSPFGTSTSRYSYLHGFGANPVTGDLEVAFSWRERTSAWCSASGLGNHDLGYLRSPDGGLTWKNNDGAQIGATGTADQVSVEDPHVAVPIAINRGLINQEAQAFDREGRLHVMTSQFNDEDLAKLGGCHTQTYPQRAQYAKPYHHWRGVDGAWHTTELPYYSGSAGRTKLLFDKHDTLYLVLPDGRISAATAAGDWQDWRIVFDAPDVDTIAELIIDRQRLDVDGVLSVAYQEPSRNNAPSAFRVADFAIDPTATLTPKATTPEPTPAAYAGSAASPAGPTALASSAQSGYAAGLAVDGNAGTFWVSGGTTDGAGPQPDRPETLVVDYPSPRLVHDVVVVPRSATSAPRAFSIDARVDGRWKRLASVEQGRTTTTHTVPTTRTDQLRFVFTAAWDNDRTPDKARNVQVAEIGLKQTDRVAPASAASVDGHAGGRTIDVGWTASDAAPSWGLERVELWAKGPGEHRFTKVDEVRTDATAGRFAYTATQGAGAYEFATRAVDQAENAQDEPTVAQATATVAADPAPPAAATPGPVGPVPAPAIPAPAPKPGAATPPVRLRATGNARLATLLRSGVMTRTLVTAPGTIVVRLQRGRTVLAEVTREVTRAGTYRVRLRPTAAGRRALRSIDRGERATLRVSTRVRVDGRSRVAKATLRVRG